MNWGKSYVGWGGSCRGVWGGVDHVGVNGHAGVGWVKCRGGVSYRGGLGGVGLIKQGCV